MRFVVYGAGAVGGVLAAGLHTAGDDVVCIARGAHLDAIQAEGLRVDTPEGSSVVPVRAVGHPREVDWTAEHVVLLAMKSQDTEGALEALAECAPSEIAAAFERAGFSALAQRQIMRWKYRKLLMNLGNIVEALCERGPEVGDVVRQLHGEGAAVLDAAKIRYVTS